MAEEKKAEEDAEEGEEGGEEAAAAKPKRPRIKIAPQTAVALLNTVLALGAVGTFAYTKLLYKKPEIREEDELRRRQQEVKAPVKPAEMPLVNFDQLSANIAPTSGKAHYATIKLSLECSDENGANAAKAQKDALTDRLLAILGKKQLSELNTIQGKLLLKTELLREFNAVIERHSGARAGVSDVYFSTFILQ